MKVLLHTCCSCCALGAVNNLADRGHEIACYFYNPNIHPASEYIARHESMDTFVKTNGLLLITGKYEIERYFKAIGRKYDDRCPDCYSLRLNETAAFAKLNGYEAVSTTLLTSIYQDHEYIKDLGARISKRAGLSFLYFDNRKDFRRNQEHSRELGMYSQKYCGCIFSERERNQKKINKTLSS